MIRSIFLICALSVLGLIIGFQKLNDERAFLNDRDALSVDINPQILAELTQSNQIMFSMHQQGDKASARKAAHRSVYLAGELFGTRHAAYGTALHHVGWLAMDSHDFDEAEVFLTKSLNLRRELLGEDSEPVANDYGCLAITYARLYSNEPVVWEKIPIIKDYFNRCLTYYEKNIAQYRQFLKTYLINAADFYQKIGERPEADRLRNRSRSLS